MKWLALVLLLLIGCEDSTGTLLCDQANLPLPPFPYAERVITGDRLEWWWNACPSTIDCVFCFKVTEVWAWDGCTWVYIETLSELFRCREMGDD